MEEAQNLDAIIFDKTGTLTEGEYGVVEMMTLDDVFEDCELGGAGNPPRYLV